MKVTDEIMYQSFPTHMSWFQGSHIYICSTRLYFYYLDMRLWNHLEMNSIHLIDHIHLIW